MADVNSENYWDERFKNDWDAKNGHQQSEFFMGLAIDMLPQWLKKEMTKGGKSVCDWGCAEGDGTSILAATYPNCSFEGIDFAETAIKIGQTRYANPNLNLLAKDLLTTKHDKRYDIVFSSNVFEHFHDPWDVFKKISIYANELFIMMVPFNEDEINRTIEHFHSFRNEQFLLQYKNWDIVHFEVRRTHGPWEGEQAVIIFARKGWAQEYGLTFADINLSADRIANSENTLDSLKEENRLLKNEKLTLKNEKFKLENEVASQNEQLIHLGELVNSRRFQLSTKFVDQVHRAAPAGTIRRAVLVAPIKAAKHIKSAPARQEIKKIERQKQKEKESFKKEVLRLVDAHPSVVIYPSMPWHHVLYQRPHHIARHLAELGQMVIYVDRVTPQQLIINDNLVVVHGDWCFEALVKSKARNRYLMLHSTHDQPFEEIQDIVKKGYKFIYEYIDEIDESINHNITNQKELFERLPELNPVLLLASAKVLYAQLEKRFSTHKLLMSGNGVDPTHFSLTKAHDKSEAPEDLKSIIELGKPIVGYYGAMAPWLDYKLINQIALSRQDLSFVFIGSDYQDSLKKLQPGPNVFYLGGKDYSVLPTYSYWFDCAIIPFKKGDVAKATSPLKLFEYMAMGIPTVCTKDLQECSGFNYVYMSKTNQEFNKNIDTAIESKKTGECTQSLLEQVGLHTWSSRAVELYDRLAEISREGH